MWECIGCLYRILDLVWIKKEKQKTFYIHTVMASSSQLCRDSRLLLYVVFHFLLNTAVLILLKDLCFYSSVIYVQVIAVFTLLYSKTINPAFSLFIIYLFILVELNEPALSDFIALVQYKCTHFRKWCGVFQWTKKIFCLEDRKKTYTWLWTIFNRIHMPCCLMYMF